MTLKIYTAKDSKGNEWAPDTTHEARATEWMLKKAWEEFHHLHELYAIIANLRQPRADMVVLTERGLGVLELKHKFGEIKINPDGSWNAGLSHIKCGIHLNPREQVRAYARDLRRKVLTWILPRHMRMDLAQSDNLKFQTAVCFTNKRARLETVQKHIEQWPLPLEPWENEFSIIKAEDLTAWIRELRFQMDEGRNFTGDYEPVRLEPLKIVRIVTDVLGNVEWTEIYPAMPVGKPYGYLILEDAQDRQIFRLVRDHLIIGRGLDCDVIIPQRYGWVSNKHCAIERYADSIEVTDLESRNGTYLNGNRVTEPRRLRHGSVLVLGSTRDTESVCRLKFELREQTQLHAEETRGDQSSSTISNEQ